MDRIAELKRSADQASRRAWEDPKAQEEVRAALAEAYKLAPEDPEILLALGQSAYRDACRQRSQALDLKSCKEVRAQKQAEFVRLHRECLVHLKRAFELGLDGYTEISRIVASNHFHLDDIDRPIGHLMIQQVLSEDPAGRACRHFQKAVFLSTFDHDREGAEGELDKALDIERHPKSLTLRGVLRSRSGDYAGAMRDFDEAVSLAPRDPGPLSARARTRMKLDDAAGAAADFAAAFAQDPPEGYEPWMEMGEACDRCGRWEQAIAAYGEAMPRGANTLAALKRALAKEKAGDLLGAGKDLDIAFEAPGLQDEVRKIRQRIEPS